MLPLNEVESYLCHPEIVLAARKHNGKPATEEDAWNALTPAVEAELVTVASLRFAHAGKKPAEAGDFIIAECAKIEALIAIRDADGVLALVHGKQVLRALVQSTGFDSQDEYTEWFDRLSEVIDYAEVEIWQTH